MTETVTRTKSIDRDIGQNRKKIKRDSDKRERTTETINTRCNRHT